MQAALVFAALLGASTLLWLSAALWPEPPPCGSPGDAGCAPAAPPAALDVVSVAAAPGCVVAAAVASLNRFAAPRRVVLLAPSAPDCAALEDLAPNVRCLLEDDLVPGARIQSRLSDHVLR